MNITVEQPLEIQTLNLDQIKLPDWLIFTDYTSLQKEEINNLINNHIWVTARRKKIPVRKMTTSHINNCIKCFNGQGNCRIPEDYLGGREKWLDIFETELTSRC